MTHEKRALTLQPPSLPGGARKRRLLRRTFGALAGVVVLAFLFIPFENWRARRAWQSCQRELAVRGEKLDWNSYIPSTVADGENVFKVPQMSEWFVGRDTNDLLERLDPKHFFDSIHHTGSVVVAELRVLNSETNLNYDLIDALLRWWSGHAIYTRLHISETNMVSADNPNPGRGAKLIPLIVLDQVPLPDAIGNLARIADLQYVVDSKIDLHAVSGGKDATAPSDISVSWEDITAKDALLDLLAHHNLRWVEDPKSGIHRITFKDPSVTFMPGFPKLREHLGELFRNALDPTASAYSPQGFTLVKTFSQIQPAQIAFIVPSTNGITAIDIEGFLPTNNLPVPLSDGNPLSVITSGTNVFRIVLDPSRVYTPQEFLSWNDQFQPQFELIREALKRPHARMEGDYGRPWSIPVPNFKTFRAVAQVLAQRGQCHLLLQQPEAALNDLTLIHEMYRLLPAKPNGLTSGMLISALAGTYVALVADGLRMRGWNETQLLIIERQLAEVHLLPLLAESLRCERVIDCGVLQAFCATTHGARPENADVPAEFKSIGGLTWLPRSVFDQNLVRIALLHQKCIDSLDLRNNQASVIRVKAWKDDVEQMANRIRPYSFFAAIIIPDYTGAIQTVSRNQTLADHARIACCLERFRIANGRYPEKLESLIPRFIEKLPSDIISGNAISYHCRSETRFLLYSVGWNNTDEGGAKSSSSKTGDWVWDP